MDDATDTLEVFDMTPETIARNGKNTPTTAEEESAPKAEQPEKGDAKPEEKQETPTLADADEMKRLRDSIATYEKRITDKDKYIGKLANDLGSQKKALAKLMDAMGIEGDPEEALQAKREAEEAEREKHAETYRKEVTKWVSEKFPKFGEMMPRFEKMLKDDKVDDETVSAFKLDPYGFPTDTLVSLVKRAEMAEMIEDRDKQIEELKQKLAGIPTKLAAAAKAQPPKTSPVADVSESDEYDVYDLTPQELKARLKKAKA